MSQHGYPERVSRRGGRGGKACSEEHLGTIEVLVETLTGTAFEMTVSPLDTVLAIKSKIFRVEGIPISQQHLLYNLKELDDASSLRDHQIDDGATLRLVLSMRGGPISTRRLPLPAVDNIHWREITDLVESNRDDSLECLPAGCKVTVLMFRDGDNVNLIRVIENEDGTFSPLADNSPYIKSLAEPAREELPASSKKQENDVTKGKMCDLRQRMESLNMQRSKRNPGKTADEAEAKLIQKTRSEETLSTMDGLFGESEAAGYAPYAPYAEADDGFSPLYDGTYTRYDYDCSFADRYTLLPPISGVPFADSDLSLEEDRLTVSTERASDRIKLSDALAGSILVKSSGVRREVEEEAAAILEEGLCMEGATVEGIGRPEAQIATKLSAPIPTAEYGPLVGGVGGDAGGWRVSRAFGSSSQLAPPAPLAAAAHSASSLQLLAPPPRHHPPLSDALFSSSTSDLEKLKRNRFLPALCRHRNREHLDVSDERLDRDDRPPVDEERRRPARNLEVGSERRHRRIKKIAELEHSRMAAEGVPRPSLFRFDNAGYESSIRKLPNDGISGNYEESAYRVDPPIRSAELRANDRLPPPEASQALPRPVAKEDMKEKKTARVRCGLCKKRLSIATVHVCRCGAEFCAPHRYAEVHGCAYDYKAHAHQYLQRANPLVSAPKLPKI